jgi:oligopeptidase B
MLPPRATPRAFARELHGKVLSDEFHWLRDRDDPAVLEYLAAENAYAEEATAHLGELQLKIFAEIKSRVRETDLSAPARRGDWWYGRRTEEGRQYPIYLRWRGSPHGQGEVILDQNQLAQGHGFCALGLLDISPDQELMAYSIDYSGNEDFQLRFRRLQSGEESLETLTSTYYGGAWSAAGDFFYYTTLDQAHRPFRLWRHRLGTNQEEDFLVFEEPDQRFYLSAQLSRDESFVLIDLESSTTSETAVIPAADPEAGARVLLPRQPGVRYRAEHQPGRWLIVTDQDAPNGTLLSLPEDDLSPGAEQVLIAHDPQVKVARVLPFSRHLVVSGRRGGLPSMTIIGEEGETREPDFDEPSYSLSIGENLEYQSSRLRLEFESFLTPRRVIDLDLDRGETTVVKETEVPGDYDPGRYRQERIWATAGDGSQVPISLVMRRDLALPAPTLLYGYGAYESVVDPWFSPARFSLLDRGAVYAVAHVRGGGEMGRLWHQGGRMEHKHYSFDDFIASAEHLIRAGIAQPGRIAARGVSAGGLLMGAAATQRPDLWAAVVAEVPFVDVINTMLDPSIPLTVGEWEEWGNPALPEQFAWMSAYSPYDRTGPGAYPAILATAGLNDARVAFWEPAKWVARLREVNTGSRPIILKTEMGAGHSGPSGRYDSWYEEAFNLAFLLDQMGLAGVEPEPFGSQ